MTVLLGGGAYTSRNCNISRLQSLLPGIAPLRCRRCPPGRIQKPAPSLLSVFSSFQALRWLAAPRPLVFDFVLEVPAVAASATAFVFTVSAGSGDITAARVYLRNKQQHH